MSNSLWPHGLQHARLPCPSLSPKVCSNSYPLVRWCHPTISFSVAPFSCPQSFPASESFPVSQLLTSILKYWSFIFSISPSSEYSGLIYFRIDLFDLLQSRGLSRVFSPTPQFRSVSSSMLSLLYGPTLTSIHGYWKNNSFDYKDLCWQSDVSAFEYTVSVCHSFSSKEQASFNFMAAVTICSDFWSPRK